MDKFCEAICAFANDMPNSRQCGYLLIGVTDDGRRNGQAIFTIDRITEFEAKITQPATTQNLPNPLSEILHLMQENPHITYTELASRLHISRESIRKHLKTLRDRYQLITRVGGTRGSWVTHTRPEK
jgi:predicted HTH transcriptional regulator